MVSCNVHGLGWLIAGCSDHRPPSFLGDGGLSFWCWQHSEFQSPSGWGRRTSQPPLGPTPFDETAERPNRHHSHPDLTVGGKWSFRQRRDRQNPGVGTGFPPSCGRNCDRRSRRSFLALEAEIASWKRRVSDRESKLSKTAQNSSRPPGSVHLHSRQKPPPRPASGRSRGGQQGHPSRSGCWFLRSDVRRSSRCIRPCAGKECSAKAGIWTAVTATFTLFVVRHYLTRAAEVARELLGDGFSGVVITDRPAVDNCFHLRQLCWAHLRRDFQGRIAAGGEGERIGAQLLALGKKVFPHWPRARDGTVTRRMMKAHLLDLAGDLRE
ncbi:MAG: transposase, partial [Planctomycetaceae bacterium]